MNKIKKIEESSKGDIQSISNETKENKINIENIYQYLKTLNNKGMLKYLIKMMIMCRTASRKIIVS